MTEETTLFFEELKKLENQKKYLLKNYQNIQKLISLIWKIWKLEIFIAYQMFILGYFYGPIVTI